MRVSYYISFIYLTIGLLINSAPLIEMYNYHLLDIYPFLIRIHIRIINYT